MLHAKPSPYGNLQGVYVSIVVLHLYFENDAKWWIRFKSIGLLVSRFSVLASKLGETIYLILELLMAHG